VLALAGTLGYLVFTGVEVLIAVAVVVAAALLLRRRRRPTSPVER
jgi:MFS superfamily sulfate permease-like transporter